jgi:creatinine amidohydrolase/Fe(II)-dependent formamide hydrolase-like protein
MGQHFYDGCHSNSSQMGGSAMTPEERAKDAWMRAAVMSSHQQQIEIIAEAIREAYEDAARIAIDSTIETAVAVVGRDVARAIRARTSEEE